MPSILLCSFGSYNLSYFNAVYPAIYTGNYEVFHGFSDMLSAGASNHTDFNEFTDMNVATAYGYNDVITYNKTGGFAASNTTGWPHVSVNSSGYFNFSTPQLLGLIRSVAIVDPNTVELYNDVTSTRWCVMWTPYRLNLDHPPSASSPNWGTDTGSIWNRQLDSGQVFTVGINLMGTAIQQDQAWQGVRADSAGPKSDIAFPRVLSVQFVDFVGKREEEWLSGSASSQYLEEVLLNNDPDGFELLGLDNAYELSVQKELTTTLSGLQKIGWPWNPWPWSDKSAYQVSQSLFVFGLGQITLYTKQVLHHSAASQNITCFLL